MMLRAPFILCLALGVAGPAVAGHLQAYAEDAEAAMQKLRAEMMAHMQEAMAKGPAAAINVCQHLAPEIGARIADETGWKIRRVSLRPRTPANAADERERSILEGYRMRAAAGQRAPALRTTALVEEDGARRVHVMQAIPMLEPCKVCHGTDIDPDVAARIAEAYPEDQAVGYEVGEIRGAFSLSRPYEEGFGLPPEGWDRIAALHFDEIEANALPGDPDAGRTAYRAACKSCHDPVRMAEHVFAAKDEQATSGFCQMLETHGMEPAEARCDIAGFLIAVSELMAGR